MSLNFDKISVKNVRLEIMCQTKYKVKLQFSITLKSMSLRNQIVGRVDFGILKFTQQL